MASTHAHEKTIEFGTMVREGILPKAIEDKGCTVEVTEPSEWGIIHAAPTRGDRLSRAALRRDRTEGAA